MPRLPDFLVIGAAKSGTTTLYHWLREHPGVFLPDFKEPYFFSSYKPSRQSVRELEEYERLFEGAGPDQLVGEASAGYLYCEEAPGRIREQLGPDVRLIAVLRHPVDRAHSMFWHRKRDAEEPLDFREALEAEPGRIEEGWQLGWHYLAMGRYRQQLERYREMFPPENLLVLCFDDLRTAPERCLQQVTRFLGLEPFPELPTAENENRSYQIRFPVVERIIRSAVGGPESEVRRLLPPGLKQLAKDGLRRLNRKRSGYERLTPELRQELTERFRDDIEYLTHEGQPGFEAWARQLR